MAIDARFQDEEGHVIAELQDSQALVPELLRSVSLVLPDSRCLRFIDEYGDAVFNQLQIPVLLSELQAVTSSTEGKVRQHAEQLVSLVAKANGQVHTYIKFVGD